MVKFLKNQLAWIGSNPLQFLEAYLLDMPQIYNTYLSLKMEVAILNFGCKATLRLNTTIDRAIEKCTKFYKGMCFVHNQCMILVGAED